jgi:outer membrane lipoprotein-sorting protein
VKSLPDGVDVKADMEGKFVTLQIIPRKKGSSIKKLLVTFLETGGISRLVIEERNNDSTVINFRNMRRNTGLSEEDFYLE